MNLDINLKYFFNKNYNFRSTDEYKKNLSNCHAASQKLILEIKNQSNEIVNSFSIDYQNKIKLLRDKIVKKKNQLVIGMGGSSAGAKAINMYLGSSTLFLDNYDPEYLNNFFKDSNLNNFTIYIISKSGETFETLAMLNLLFQHLIKISILDEVKKNIIVITEDSDNLLNNFAKKNNLQLIPHNKKIGGRFSVFTETAMILFDLEAQKISDSAESLVSKLIENNLEDESNPTVNAAVILTLQEKYNVNYNINILYQYSLKDYSYWFQQLFAESLGKNKKALTPITSICPKDHHSVLQLFIGGPKNKLFNIYPPSQDSYFKNFSQLGLGKIETKTPKNLLELQCLSMIQTFKEEEIPHRIIKFTESHEDKAYNMFELFSYNILETIILGYAQNLNPYDQPSVEKIKKNTFSF